MATCEKKRRVLKALLVVLLALLIYVAGCLTPAIINGTADPYKTKEGITYVAGEDSAVFGGSLPNTFQSFVITQKNGWRWVLIQNLYTGDFSVIPFLDSEGNQVNVSILDPQPEDSAVLNSDN